MARKESPLANRQIRGGLFQRTDAVAGDIEETPEKPPKEIREKRTYHLPPDAIRLLDKLQWDQREATGKKPELSELVTEAIRLLAETRQQNS